MIWLRRGFVGFLSLLLLLTILGGAFLTSAKLNLTDPAKIESWLAESRLYDHFVNGVIQETEKSDDAKQSGSVSLNDAAVQTAAKAAFSPQLIEQSVKAFLEGNYAWLEGKTAKPEFKIDLTAAKQSFAEQVGEYVRVYTAGLPVCIPTQLVALQAQPPAGPLSATCRPPTLTPEAAGAETTRQLSGSGDFLSKSVITAQNINPENKGQGQPYYEKLSFLPDAYQLAVKLPWIFGAAAILLSLAIIFIAPRKRAGLRRIAFVLAGAGVILVAGKFLADSAIQRVEDKVFNTADNGQLQQALADFAQRAETALAQVLLLLGIACLMLALTLFITLFRTQRKEPNITVKDSTEKSKSEASDTPQAELKKPEKPEKPPRLVQ